MDTTTERLKRILNEALQLGPRAAALTPASRLMGAIPEFDSMAVVTVLGLIEEEFGFTIDDDDISAEVFETLQSLTDFVAARAAR